MSARIRPGRFCLGERDRFGMGARDADDPMAEALHQRLDVHGDEGLVLDDEDVGGDLGRELAAGFLDQVAQRRKIDNPGSRPRPPRRSPPAPPAGRPAADGG